MMNSQHNPDRLCADEVELVRLRRRWAAEQHYVQRLQAEERSLLARRLLWLLLVVSLVSVVTASAIMVANV